MSKKKVAKKAKARRIRTGSFTIGNSYDYKASDKIIPIVELHMDSMKSDLLCLSLRTDIRDLEVSISIRLTREEGLELTRHLMTYYKI